MKKQKNEKYKKISIFYPIKHDPSDEGYHRENGVIEVLVKGGGVFCAHKHIIFLLP